MTGKRPGYEQVFCGTRTELRAWLEAHHQQSPGIWLVYFKQSSGKADLTPSEIVDEALCFGWIDSLPGKVDDEKTRILLTPRKRGSGWSRVNKAKIERLIEKGRMTPTGQARIETAIADGSWTLLDDIEALVIPADLAAALEENPLAKEHFHAFSPSAKKPLLEWIQTAKRPETRQRRIETIVTAAEANRNPRKWVPKENRSSY